MCFFLCGGEHDVQLAPQRYALNGACCPVVAAVKQAKASACSQEKYSEARPRRR